MRRESYARPQVEGVEDAIPGPPMRPSGEAGAMRQKMQQTLAAEGLLVVA